MSKDEPKRPTQEPAPKDTTLHKAPSMLWFIIPLGVLMTYAVLSAR